MSESEEMYLISIAMLLEEGTTSPVPLAAVASRLDVQVVSANQMVRKLEDEGFVNYTPYRGVELTADGTKAASRILRHRRLWEVFLVEYLHFNELEAERVSCRLEHILTDDEIGRLADYLGKPLVSPQNKLIPQGNEEDDADLSTPLIDVRVGNRYIVSKIQTDSETRKFLAAQGVIPKAEIQVLATGYNGEMLIQLKTGETVHISGVVASAVWVDLSMTV